MRRIRIIPVLLLNEQKLVKSQQFKDYKYVGDPINAVKIFNEKEVDEIIVVDISATKKHGIPDFKLIQEIASEAFMPLGYGGGVNKLEHIEKLLFSGVEKVIINSKAIQDPGFVEEAAKRFGSSTIVVSIDIKRNLFSKPQVHSGNTKIRLKISPKEFAQQMENRGAGEIFLNSIDRDGTFKGYDIPLIKEISSSITIPLIACGGASNIADFTSAVNHGGASAVAAGSYFVFKGKHKAVLITYPPPDEILNFYNSIF